MRWFRYKHKWAHGDDREWEYRELGDSDYQMFFADGSELSAEDYIEDLSLCNEGNWSDKYRGIDYDVVDSVPREILKKKFDNAENAAKSWARTAARYQNELNRTENNESDR